MSRNDSRLFRPQNIVHFCFAVVFIFASLLTWREALTLNSAYEASHRAMLIQVGSGLERQWQQSIDEMFFFRNMLRHALGDPLETDKSRDALNLFDRERGDPLWRITINTERSIPINGISDASVQRTPLLNRDDPHRLEDELKAALEMSYIMQFNNPLQDFHFRLWYVSRAGFYLSSKADDNKEALTSYNTVIKRPYFLNASPEKNPSRRMTWTETYSSMYNEGDVVTVTLPVDNAGYWYGVLAMDFSTRMICQYLEQVQPNWQDGNLVLFDRGHKPVATSNSRAISMHGLTAAELDNIFTEADKPGAAQSGHLHFGLRFITWVRLQNFDGLLVNVNTLHEGRNGEIGRVSLVLILIWVLFSLVLIASHQAIIRMTQRLLLLQETLSWRANYDGLTRVLNRSAFFYQANKLAEICEQNKRPLSLIQLDLDHFKAVNDTQGHQAGDIVLAHAAAIILEAVRKMDVLGRVGGEEFCIVLHDTGLQKATEIAERIRYKLAAKEVLVNTNHTLKVTASLGVSSSEENNVYHIDSLQSVADDRLYLAKEAGRNRVCNGA